MGGKHASFADFWSRSRWTERRSSPWLAAWRLRVTNAVESPNCSLKAPTKKCCGAEVSRLLVADLEHPSVCRTLAFWTKAPNFSQTFQSFPTKPWGSPHYPQPYWLIMTWPSLCGHPRGERQSGARKNMSVTASPVQSSGRGKVVLATAAQTAQGQSEDYRPSYTPAFKSEGLHVWCVKCPVSPQGPSETTCAPLHTYALYHEAQTFFCRI